MNGQEASAAAPLSRLRLAHLSDPHLTSLSGVSPLELFNKRILGYLSWRWRRRSIHRREVLSVLTADLAAASPDHIAITGDLTHVGTPRECHEAARWLQETGTPDRITLVPGNHDRYTAAPWDRTLGLWREYMAGDGAIAGDPFPFARRRGPVALIGLSTAVPTPPFFASGRLGGRQLVAAEALLDEAKHAGLFRVVLLHHPPVARLSTRRRGLADGPVLRSLLAKTGAELALHGHMHRWTRNMLETGEQALPVLGVPSASAREPGERRAGYSLFEITATDRGWEVMITERVLNPPGDGMETRSQRSLLVPRVVQA